jgi:hypothetical protein
MEGDMWNDGLAVACPSRGILGYCHWDGFLLTSCDG